MWDLCLYTQTVQRKLSLVHSVAGKWENNFEVKKNWSNKDNFEQEKADNQSIKYVTYNSHDPSFFKIMFN